MALHFKKQEKERLPLLTYLQPRLSDSLHSGFGYLITWCNIQMVIKEIILTLVICLVLTLVLEEVTALIIGVRKGFDLIVILFSNLLTNPVVVYAGIAFASFTKIPRPVYVIVLELAAFIIEALIYRKLLFTKKPSPFLLSLILNCVSFFIGSTLSSLILGLFI